MSTTPLSSTAASYPLRRLVEADEPGVLAVITGVDGPSYRPLGAMMAIFPDMVLAGSLSSGCVEADIALHAEAAQVAGQPTTIRYGKGSPFKDISLPCGGGLDILLIPNPDRETLSKLCAAQDERRVSGLRVDPSSGRLQLHKPQATGWAGENFDVLLEPELAFHVFGKGPEASTFAALAQSAGFTVLLLSPDDETLQSGAAAGCATRHLNDPSYPADVEADPFTAVLLFFHDHEWEPPILERALSFPALYIGAQGSAQARRMRDVDLLERGLSFEAINRIKGPIGLVPSARDARSLAVGVLAEVLSERRTRPETQSV